MATIDIQKLVDELCEFLNRSIAVDDSELQVIAASAQVGHIDAQRSEAILRRRATPEVVSYVLSQIAGHDATPFLVPGSSELATLPRWCFPLYQGGEALGYLWLIDVPGLTAEEMEVAGEFAERMALVLAASRREVTEAARRSEYFLSRMLQLRSAEDFYELARQSPLAAEGEINVWCFGLTADARVDNPQGEGQWMGRVVDRVLSNPSAPNVLVVYHEDYLTMATRSARSARELERALTPAVQRAASSQGLNVSSCGWDRFGEDQAPAVTLDHARFAAKVSRLSFGGSAISWDQLGAWSLLYQQEWSPGTVKRLSSSCDLLVRQENPRLWRTLLAYLDSACNVATTCDALNIQRATLYYRLGRIREIAGAGILDDGWGRTSGHLALKLHSVLAV